jgi:chemotaxis response regulator CheB
LGAVRGDIEPARVLVAHESVERLEAFIARVEDRDDFEIVAVATDGFEAVNTAQELQPDITVLSRGLPRVSGFEALRYIRAAAPRGSVVVTSDLVADAGNATLGELQVLLDGSASATEGHAVDLPAAASAAASAREFVHDATRALCRDDVVSVATLLVSEVVTNAVVHARSASRLALVVEGDALRVRLTDWGDGALELRQVVPTAVSGRGLHIVDGLATVWGTVATPRWKRVFFVVGRRDAARTEAPAVATQAQTRT